MHMSPQPDLAGLGLVGGAAEEEAFQGGAVEGEQGPKVAEPCEGRGGKDGACNQHQADEKARKAPHSSRDDQENTIDPQGIGNFQAGEGEIRQHGDGGVEEDFCGSPVEADGDISDQQAAHNRQCPRYPAGAEGGGVFEEIQ